MRLKSLAAVLACCAFAMALVLAGCGGSASGSASSSTTGTSSAAASPSASAAVSSAGSSGSSAGASNPTGSASASASGAGSAAATQTAASGQKTATGTVVTTTYAERAAEVGLSGGDYANDTGLLTLLVLDQPITVTAYKGGSDYTGEASVIRLPNDEMFRQFSGKQITIRVDAWGEWPADLSGKLYDLVVDFEADGLALVE